MGRRQRAEVKSDPSPGRCEHVWRLRNVSVAMPGPYLCDVCDRCGALHIDGPEAVTGPPSTVADAAALYLESLPRWSPPSAGTG